MSQQNVDIMRRIYDDWGRGNFRSGVERFDPDIVLVLGPEFPDAGTYVGPQEIERYMRDLLSAWAEFAIEGESFIDAGKRFGRGPSARHGSGQPGRDRASLLPDVDVPGRRHRAHRVDPRARADAPGRGPARVGSLARPS